MKERLLRSLESDKWVVGTRSTEAKISEFEEAHKLRLPDDFRYVLLNLGSLKFHGRLYCEAHRGYMQAFYESELHYFGGPGSHETIEVLWAELWFNHSPEIEAAQLWTYKLLPFALIPGDGYLCLDFAFDGEAPPVVLHTDTPWSSPPPGPAKLNFVAGSVTELFELQQWDYEDGYPEGNGEPSEKARQWATWSDQVLGR